MRIESDYAIWIFSDVKSSANNDHENKEKKLEKKEIVLSNRMQG